LANLLFAALAFKPAGYPISTAADWALAVVIGAIVDATTAKAIASITFNTADAFLALPSHSPFSKEK